jgi:hypothetical protein
MLAATPKEGSMNRCILIGCGQTVPESRRLYCSDAHRDGFYRWVRSQSRDETIGVWVEERLQVMEEMEQEEAEDREKVLRERLDCLAIILEQLKGEIEYVARELRK